MWEFELEGKGRRATVLSASNGNKRYKPGDLIELENGVVGMISSLHQDVLETSHSVDILLFEEDGSDESSDENNVGSNKETSMKEFLVTNKFKKFGLDQIVRKNNDLKISGALDYAAKSNTDKKPLPKPVTEFESATELADLVTSMFRQSPRKSPRKKRAVTRVSAADIFGSDDSSDSDYSSSDPDNEMELLPVRKRGAAKNRISLGSNLPLLPSKEEPPVPQPTHTPRKRQTKPAAKVTAKPSQNADKLELKAERNVEMEVEVKTENEVESHDMYDRTDSETEVEVKPSTSKPVRSGFPKQLPTTSNSKVEPSVVDRAVMALHPASDPVTHPCRDEQYDRLFIALESAIGAETGTCIYISGTPGTGKTSTVREVIGQLDLRVRENELKPFSFVEINGMKLVHPNAAYEHLWAVLNRGTMAASNSMTALENCFTANEPVSKRGVIVVLLDELDQLITKGQQLMYNFFNWPSLPHSRLVVIAIANTMDLPERVLSNKISSRVGLTRIQFTGYTHEELKSIVYQRLEPDFISLIESDAIDYVTRKVSGVGGDARRTLSLISQTIERVQPDGVNTKVKTSDIRDIIVEQQVSPLERFLKTLGAATKVLLCAIIVRVRRTNNIETPLHDVLKQARQLVGSSPNAQLLTASLYQNNSARIHTFRHAINELVESGVLVQQAIPGEATQNVRLMVPIQTVKETLENDPVVSGMI